MDFKNLFEIKEHLSSINRSLPEDCLTLGEFTPINCDLFLVRLAASTSAFSKPSVDCYDKITDYTHVQVMIEERSQLQKEAQIITCPISDERFKMFGWSKYFVYQGFDNKIINSYIGSYIPIGEIPQLIRDVNKISRLKMFF